MFRLPRIPSLLLALAILPTAFADKVKIGILRQVEIKSLVDAEEGVKAGFAAAGYDAAKVEFVCVDAKNDMGQVAPTLERFRKEKVAVVVTVGTKASIEALKLEKALPLVFTGVAYREPVLKAAKDNGNANVTGACYGNSIESALSAALKIRVGAKSVGMLVNSLEPNTRMDGDGLEAAGKKLGLKVVLLPYAGEAELAAALPKLLAQAPDCVLFPKDTAQIKNAPELAKTIAAKKLLALGLDPAYAAKKAAVLSVTTPAGKIGELSARKAIEILKGKTPASLPVEAPQEFEITVNKKAAAEAGVVLPAEVLKSATIVLED
ncbi:MAG: hypothetical protein J0L75_11305 [Spirochaetes bacterium]|nr:hypothetical protein [Spirochaetota bacterium]